MYMVYNRHNGNEDNQGKRRIMDDSKQVCPVTQTAYDTAKPVLTKLPEQVKTKVNALATYACSAESGIETLAAIPHLIGKLRTR